MNLNLTEDAIIKQHYYYKIILSKQSLLQHIKGFEWKFFNFLSNKIDIFKTQFWCETPNNENDATYYLIFYMSVVVFDQLTN